MLEKKKSEIALFRMKNEKSEIEVSFQVCLPITHLCDSDFYFLIPKFKKVPNSKSEVERKSQFLLWKLIF